MGAMLTPPSTPALFPVFLRLEGKPVLVVGGGPVAASKLQRLVEAGADITVVAPDMCAGVLAAPVRRIQREFRAADLDGQWYVVAAAPPDVNRVVAAEAAPRHIFVNAVDDPANASAYLGSLLTRSGVLVSISTYGRAPALAGLLREGLDALIPADLDRWFDEADRMRAQWRGTGVPMEARRPQLLEALNALYARLPPAPDGADAQGGAAASRSTPTGGLVSLVGAGPGAADLLTVRAVERLRDAQLVLSDGLVPPDLLRLAPHAQHVAVPRRPGAARVAQPEVVRLMIDGARRGLRVVRLKAGDPFVFGRGGEEALALGEAHVPYEIVPGLSTAIAAPGLAGIPVTHRSVSSAVVVVSGHLEEAYAPVLDTLRPGAATLVVLMGFAARAPLAWFLLRQGWALDTPVAVVARASQPDERVSTTTLAELGTYSDGAADDDPRVIVIGEVVAVGERIAALARAPLAHALAKET